MSRDRGGSPGGREASRPNGSRLRRECLPGDAGPAGRVGDPRVYGGRAGAPLVYGGRAGAPMFVGGGRTPPVFVAGVQGPTQTCGGCPGSVQRTCGEQRPRAVRETQMRATGLAAVKTPGSDPPSPRLPAGLWDTRCRPQCRRARPGPRGPCALRETRRPGPGGSEGRCQGPRLSSQGACAPA